MSLAALGRRGDTELIHATPEERRLLRERGGAGTRNPRTGLREYWTGEGDSPGNDGNPGTAGSQGSSGSNAAGQSNTSTPTEAPDTSIAVNTVPGTNPNTTSQGEAPDDGPNAGEDINDDSTRNVITRNLFRMVPGFGMANAMARGLGMIGQMMGADNTTPGDPNAPGDETPNEYPNGGPGSGIQSGAAIAASPYGAYSPIGLPGLPTLQMKRGGVARAAGTTKKAGRHGDTEIVHLSREELEALRAAWGEPTINPETGAPEYWKLGKLLKQAANVIVPAAATYLTGNPLVGAGASALTSLATGKNVKGALGNALLSYGAGKISQGFGGDSLFDSSRISSVGSDFRNFGSSISDAFSGLSGGSGLGSLGAQEYQSFDDYDVPPAPLSKPSAPTGGSDDWFERNKGLIALAAPVALGAMAPAPPKAAEAPSPRAQPPAPNWRFERRYVENPDGRPGHDYFEDYWVNDDTGERKPMAAGGLAVLREPRMFAAQGGHAGPGPVSGEGGGQDDVIPAALSDGEYVISADVVSALGDGSTEAGAKKLDAMMDQVRSHKTGRQNFPPKAKSPLSYVEAA